jgi:hypothetical protein
MLNSHTMKIMMIVTIVLAIMGFHRETHGTPPEKPLLQGTVKDAATGELLPWASVYIEELATGVSTNPHGQFNIQVPPGTYMLRISYVGYVEVRQKVRIEENTTLQLTLKAAVTNLSTMVISDKRGNEHITEAAMSVVKINTETVKKIPALMGESDLLKAIQMLPGVQNTAEGFSGFSVRGGSTDQNLIMLDEATVYNPSHLMGFFSVFNSDAVEEMTLYKGDIPARYGGRLSSLLDVKMREGNGQKISGSGGIGTVASRLTLEGPIVKDRATFLVSGRRTYADLFLKLSNDSLLNNNQLYFYDLNGKVNLNISKNHRLQLTAYSGSDYFKFREMIGMNWANRILSMKWIAMMGDKMTGNLTYTSSAYHFEFDNYNESSQFTWASGIRDHSIKYDINYYPNSNHTFRFGIQSIYHTFKPGEILSPSNEILIKANDNKSLEHALYISGEHKAGTRLTLQPGLRISGFQNIGGSDVYLMDDQYKIIDTMHFNRNKIYNTQVGLEPRLSAAYLLSEHTSVKASISRTRQYIQPASNSSSGMPHDVWFTTSMNIRPQVSDQVCLGFFRNLFENMLEVSAEVYYKTMDNQIDFRDNANLLFNDHLEGEIRTGIAKAYGVELLIRKNKGDFTGWIGYTFSRARRKADAINDGNWYNANYDKPNNFIVVTSYRLSPRVALGANWTYTSGAPITLPTSRWEHAGIIMPGYSERNGYRLPAYHRLDVSTTIQLGKKDRIRGTSNELNISVYNAYHRKNPFTIYFQPETAGSTNMKAYALSMFGIVPSITWNFKF